MSELWAKTLYVCQATVGSLKHAPGAGALSAGTMGAVLLVAGLYGASIHNLERVALFWGRAAQVTVVLAEGSGPPKWQQVRAQLSNG